MSFSLLSSSSSQLPSSSPLTSPLPSPSSSSFSSKSTYQKYIAFSISAGCYFYQLGIAYYIQTYFILNNIKFSGSSGGSWPALLLASNINIKHAFEIVITYAPICTLNRPILGAYMVYDQGISIVFHKLFDQMNLSEIINGKLALSVTRLAWDKECFFPYLKDEVVTHFYSNNDILECIIASALIPFALNGKPYVIYRNWICADGGITNVTGARRFAEELVHDIELIEEELVEQAQHIKEELVHNIRDEIFYSENNLNNNDNTNNSSNNNSQQFPITTGPKDIIQFGATITMTLIDIITESLEKIIQSHKPSNQLTQSNFEQSKLLHYQPSPHSQIGIELSEKDSHQNHVLERILSSVHPSCQQIIDKLHCISSNLHSKYDQQMQKSDLENKQNNNNLSVNTNSTSTSNSLLSNCYSYLSSVILPPSIQEKIFPDSLIPIEEIHDQEIHWLGNHVSNFDVDPDYIPKYIINRHEELSQTSVSHCSDNLPIKSDAPTYFSHTSSVEHLDCQDYQEEDDEVDNCEVDEGYKNQNTNQFHIDSHPSCLDELNYEEIQCSPTNYHRKENIILLEGGISLQQLFPSPSSSSSDGDKNSISISSNDDIFTTIKLSPPITGDMSISPLHIPVGSVDSQSHGDHNLPQSNNLEENLKKSSNQINSTQNSTQIKHQEQEKDSKEQQKEFSTDYWKNKGDIIKLIPNSGGLLLEISPWMWRHHSIWNYHLSSQPSQAIKLFNMGISDAFDHHQELQAFFDS